MFIVTHRSVRREPSTPEAAGGAASTGSTLRARVAGRVQGVGYRFFVYGTARRLGLTGSVRNLAGGQVEVVARGSRVALEELVRELHQGSRMSRVDEVHVEWGVVVPESVEFIIGF